MADLTQEKNRPKTEGTAHLALLTVALFYGFNYFIVKFVFREVHPFAVLTLRAVFGILFFVIGAQFFVKEKIERREDWIRLFLCGIFGVSLNQLFFLWGLSKTIEVNAAVLMVTSPVFVFLMAWILKEEKISKLKVAGLIAAFTGAALLSLSGRSLHLGGDTIMGDLMIAFNAASYGIYLVLVRPLMLRYNVFTIIKWVFLFGGIINIPIGIPQLLTINWAELQMETYLGLANVLILVTVGAYGLNAWAMRRVPASYVGIYIYLQPVIVTLLAYFISRESLSWEKMGYMLLVLIGVIAVSYKKKR